MHLSRSSQSPLTTFILYSQPSSLTTQLYFLDNQRPIPLNFPLQSWFNKFTVVNSCNGLICLSEISSHSHDMFIFNPSTGDYLQLPPFGHGEEVFSFGFEFDSTADKYKVVRIKSDVDFINVSDFHSSVNVYTLGDSKWRQALGVDKGESQVRLTLPDGGSMLLAWELNVDKWCGKTVVEKYQPTVFPKRSIKQKRHSFSSHVLLLMSDRQGTGIGMDLPLPVDIFLDIFSRLPIKSLVRCRCVSKTWLNLTSNPHLPKMHLSRSSQSPLTTFILYSQPSSLTTQLYFLDNQHPILLNFPLQSWFNKFTVVNSCNGLICLSEISSHSHDMFIFNPSTGDYLQLPPFGHGDEVFSFGFGFDSTVDKYKVVRIKSDVDFINVSDFRSSVNVYTLGDSKWRQALGVGGATVCYYIDQKSAGVNVNGRLHWQCYEKVGHLDYLASIAYFDLTTEELHIIPFPDFVNELDLVGKVSLVTLGGCLSFYRTTLHTFSWYRITVWVMKSYGVKESWTKQYVIKDSVLFKPSIKYAKPICLNNDGEILLLCDGKQLVAFNLKTNSYREVGFYNMLDPVVAIAHVGTIVPLGV